MRDAHAHFSGDAMGNRRQVHVPIEFPGDFVPLPEVSTGWSDRSLGYVGQARFVMFRYEPRGEEVIWNDGDTYGFGTGGWRDFLDRIAPLADRSGVNLGLGWGGPTAGHRGAGHRPPWRLRLLRQPSECRAVFGSPARRVVSSHALYFGCRLHAGEIMRL